MNGIGRVQHDIAVGRLQSRILDNSLFWLTRVNMWHMMRMHILIVSVFGKHHSAKKLMQSFVIGTHTVILAIPATCFYHTHCNIILLIMIWFISLSVV